MTVEFTDEAGRPDLVAPLGLSPTQARARCHLTAIDLVTGSHGDDRVVALARCDQAALWAAADRAIRADEAARGVGQTPVAVLDDPLLVEHIERCHAKFERTQHVDTTVRHHGSTLGATCLPGAALAHFALRNDLAALGFLILAPVIVFVMIVVRRRMELAKAREDDALAAAGKESYIGYQVQRVDRMLDEQKDLHRAAVASEESRLAAEAWHDVAPDVALSWACEHRSEIEALAARISGDHDGEVRADVNPARVAQWYAARIAHLAHVGPEGESLPLILDEPLAGVDPSAKQWILELIGRSAGSPQVIYLSADPEVAAWARLEAIAGHLSVLEPDQGPTGAVAGDPNGRTTQPA